MQLLSSSFCRRVGMNQSVSGVTIVDEWRRGWRCSVFWVPRRQSNKCCLELEGYVGGEWPRLCSTLGLKEGSPIRIGVSHKNPETFYLSLTWFNM